MKTVLLFNKEDWDIPSIKHYLSYLNDYDLRYGFSNIVVIYETLDCHNLPHSEKEILCFRYDKEKELVQKNVLVICGDRRYTQNVDYLFTQKNNIRFDLQSFGTSPQCRKKLLEIYDDTNFDIDSNIVKALQLYQCRDLLENEKLDEDIKRYFLDIYAFNAAGIQIYVDSYKGNCIRKYNCLFSSAFVLGAMIEKLIFLIAKLDNTASYYHKVINAKHVASSFQKNSKESNFELAKKLRQICINFEHFKERFRTPEAHKKGRNLSLVADGYYGTLLQEVLSYRNEISIFFGNVINYVRQQIQQS